MTLIRIEKRKGTAAVFFARPPVNAFKLQLVEAPPGRRYPEGAGPSPLVTAGRRVRDVCRDVCASRSANAKEIVTGEEGM